MKILITGASEGIGLETAKLLAADHNQITMVARNKEKLEKAMSQLSGLGHSYILADLSKPEDVDSLEAPIIAHKYDVFINNAGVGMYGWFTQLAIDEQLSMMQLNMNAVTKLSLVLFEAGKKG